MSAGAYGGQKCGPHGAGVTGGFEPPNVGPLKEQYAPLTPGPPLQPPKPVYF